jgi:flagellar hook protein FlgE
MTHLRPIRSPPATIRRVRAGELTSVEIDDDGYIGCTYSNKPTSTPSKSHADFTNYNGSREDAT